MGLFKKEYKVTYKRYCYITTTHTTYIKARGISHIQKIIERKEAPWDVQLILVEEVK